MHRFLPLALCLIAACSPEQAPDSAKPEQSPAVTPAKVELVDLAGFEAALAQRRGRPVIVNLWAMW